MLLIADNTNRVRINKESKFVLEKIKERTGESFERIVWFALEMVYPVQSILAAKEFEPNEFAGE